MHKRQYKIMIAVGAAKGCGLYEVWGEYETTTVCGVGSRQISDFTHHGYFQTREDAQAWIDHRIDNDCSSNSRQVQGDAQ